MAAQKKTSTGLKKETAGALAYVLGPITGVIFLIIDKTPYVRFHAMQSIVVFVSLMILQWVLVFTIILAPLGGLLTIVGFVLWLLLIYKAWQGEEWEVPFVGKYARKFLKKV
ncbi:DUF4870 domain-containing protein [Patescibacteria group bacterium]